MSTVQRALIVVVLGAMFVLPAWLAIGPSPEAPAQDPGELAYVRIHIPAGAVGALPEDVEVVETYDTFVLARTPLSSAVQLQRNGFSVSEEDTTSLHVNGYTFDTSGEVRVPDDLKATPVLEGHGYHLVQFIGPMKESWRWRVEARGAEVLAYVPNNAYLVRASPAALAAVQALREVQWTGDFHPAFRIAPSLLFAEGPVTVKIITFEGEPVTSVVATLNKMGLSLVGRWSEEVGILSWGQYEHFGLVRARLDAGLLVALARLRPVQYIEPNLVMELHNQFAQFVLQTNAATDGPNVRRLWDVGLRGDGQVIGISDTGLDYDHAMFRHDSTTVTIGDIYNVTNFNRRKVIRYLPMSGYVGVDPFTGGDPNALKDSPDSFCGSGHGTATSAAAAGNDTGIASSANDGMAPSAKLVIMDIGTVDTSACADRLSYIPDDYGVMYGAAYDQGARFFSNSWGACSNEYTLETSMVDRFMWDRADALVMFSNGNTGNNCQPPATRVSTPATGKNIMSISGASTWNNREVMGGALPGPTADGRMKPDIATFFATVAPGGTARSDGDLTTRNTGDSQFGGTSYSSPLAAGMAALVRQYFREGWYPAGAKGTVFLSPSAALVKAVLAASSVQMTGANACVNNQYPNNAQGWGRLWMDEALYLSGDTKKLFIVDRTRGILTGDTLEYKVRVASPTGRLRVLLAWSDFPGLPGASNALVNNLDLEIIDPSGTTYRGNNFGTCAAGQSVAGGTFDVRNPIEGVILTSPATGDWRIRVIGANVPMGAQRFGLVVLSDLDLNYGVVTIDKTVYSESDIIQIQVQDLDASGTVTVQASSSTEPAGESVTLARVGAGIWRGAIPTSYAIPAPDGRLQVSHGDTITVTYNDASPPHASTATARAEIDAPAISNVRVTAITNAAATITWTTDLPSDSTVYYGTSPALGTTATDTTVTTTHSLTLTGLSTETLYYFDVASTRAGHTTRDTNGGAHYTFKTVERAEILLVVGESSFTQDRIDKYRNALASASWSWNEWEIGRQGDPTIGTLQSYKVILWQAGLEQYPPLTDAQLTLLRNYIDNGGRIFFSGHDYAWAACDPGSQFRTPARCTFIRSIMKANYLADPTTWTQEIGFAGDPISNGYQVGGTPGPVTYVPHRGGGAGDEVGSFPAGGTSNFVWRTNTPSINREDAIRWLSGGNNGSAGPGCVWCGTPSRVVTYFYEFTGINFVAGQASNAARTDILNKTIVWLLGRAPPTVRVVSPNGGETISTSTLTVTWSRSQPLSSQEVWYSQNGGEGWNLVKTVGPTNTSDVIDISNVAVWPNGDRYMIRIVAVDAGSPAFRVQDASDATFRINRAGGDVLGPLVWPGSLRVSPNPARNGTTLRINATIDDTLRGLSNLNAAEYFIQVTEPPAGAYGTGTPMTAVDGAFSSPMEAVTATFTVNFPEGSTQTVWVHGRDAATPTNNWGPFASLSFLVIPGITIPPPDPPTNVQARLVGASSEHVRISWQIPAGQIDRFTVFFSTTYDAGKVGYAVLPGADSLPANATSFDHANAGDGDPNTYFYYVRAVNAAGGANSVDQVAKFTRTLSSAGWNIVSMPVIPADASLSAALQTLNWRSARTYVSTDGADPWKAWNVAKGQGDLTAVSVGLALWVDIVSPDDFTVAGRVPTSTTTTLVPGWNFVGYASFIVRPANVAFPGPLGITMIEGYSAAPQYYLVRLALTTNLEPGRGYWVYATTGGSWTVTN